jgi:hypothetical protein
MKLNEFITALLICLGIIATAFVTVRSDMEDLSREVSSLQAQVDAIHEVCCGEIN